MTSFTKPAQKLLVTGAAGFIGSHSVDRLLAEGHQVVAVDNLRTGHGHNLSNAQAAASFEFVHADVSDETAMSELFQQHRFDGVLHLAALVSVPESFSEPTLNARINLYATDILARLCLQHQCPRMVLASSAAVYGTAAELPNRETAMPQPMSPYAAAKLASEIMLLGYAKSYSDALQAVCLRYFNVYGPRQDPSSPYSGVLSIFSERFQKSLPITVYGDGEQTRDFINVRDVAAANCQALTAETVTSDRYNVCTGQTVSLNQILKLLQEIYLNAPKPQYAEARVGDIRHSLGDPSRLQAAFKLEPTLPFTQGLQDLLNG